MVPPLSKIPGFVIVYTCNNPRPLSSHSHNLIAHTRALLSRSDLTHRCSPLRRAHPCSPLRRGLSGQVTTMWLRRDFTGEVARISLARFDVIYPARFMATWFHRRGCTDFTRSLRRDLSGQVHGDVISPARLHEFLQRHSYCILKR